MSKQKDSLLQAIEAADGLDEAWQILRDRWQEAPADFVSQLFRASDAADRRGDQAKALLLLRLCWLIGRWQKNEQVMLAAIYDAATILRDREPKKAANLFEQALAGWQALDGVAAERNVADCHHELGNIYFAYLADLPLAKRHYQTGLKIYRRLDDPKGIADALGGLGNILRYEGDLETAVAYFNRAIQLVRPLKNVAALLPKLNNLGLCLHMRGDMVGAVACYEEVLELADNIKDGKAIASAAGNLGGVLMNVGELGAATAVLQRGLGQARQQHLEREEGLLLSLLGATQLYGGQIDLAEATMQAALAIFEALNEPLAATGVLTNLGLVAQARQQLNKALAYLQEALTRYRQKGEQQGQAQVLCNLGAIYDELEQKAEAQRCFEEARDICRTIGYRQGEGTALAGLGLCYLDAGRYEVARTVYQEAMAIDEAIGYQRGVAINHANLGLIAFRLRELMVAKTHYEVALSLARAIGDSDGEANGLQMLGRIAVEQEAYEEALVWYAEAATVAKEHGLTQTKHSLQNQVARVLAAMGDAVGAFAQLQEVLAAQGQTRSALTSESHRLSYWETQHGIYQNMVWVCLELAAQEKGCNGRSCLKTALETVEQARSRTLIDRLAGQPLPVPDRLPSDLVAAEQAALGAIAVAKAQQLLGRETLQAQREIEQQEERLQAVWEAMQVTAAEYVALRRGQGFSLAAIQDCLRWEIP